MLEGISEGREETIAFFPSVKWRKGEERVSQAKRHLSGYLEHQTQEDTNILDSPKKKISECFF